MWLLFSALSSTVLDPGLSVHKSCLPLRMDPLRPWGYDGRGAGKGSSISTLHPPETQGNGPSRHPGPHPTGQRPPQLILPAGLSLRLPPAPTATALGPEPALRKNSCEPRWLQKPGEPGLDSPVQAWALLPGPNSTGPQAGEEAEAWRRGRTSAGTRAELTG